jgi:hypothetical protein
MTFYLRWIMANAWAEAVGLGTTLVLARMAAPMVERTTGVVSIVSGVAAAILVGTFLEGVIVGVAQERVLRRRLPDVRPGAWIAATTVGAGLAWILGMIPSTIVALTSLGAQTASAPSAPGAAVQYGLATLLGLVAGPVLGLAQWTVLRQSVPGAAQWLWANALAWAVGMPVIFAGMDIVPWTAPFPIVVAAVYLVCGAAGLVVGAIHGRVLSRLLSCDLVTVSP